MHKYSSTSDHPEPTLSAVTDLTQAGGANTECCDRPDTGRWSQHWVLWQTWHRQMEPTLSAVTDLTETGGAERVIILNQQWVLWQIWQRQVEQKKEWSSSTNTECCDRSDRGRWNRKKSDHPQLTLSAVTDLTEAGGREKKSDHPQPTLSAVTDLTQAGGREKRVIILN